MAFFQAENVHRRPWSLYTRYTIAPLSQMLIDLDPVNANQIEGVFRAHLNADGIDTIEDKKWAEMMAREIIYPSPDADDSPYDAWTGIDKEKSFDHFADLWRNDCAPSNSEILEWVLKYGLPCRSPSTGSLYIDESNDGPGNDLKVPLQFSTHLKSAMRFARVSLKYATELRWENIMFTEVFIALCKEAHSARIVYALINNGGTVDGLDWDLERKIIFFNSPPITERQAEFRLKMALGFPISKKKRKGISPYFRQAPFTNAVQRSSYVEHSSSGYDIVAARSYFSEILNPFNDAVRMSSYLKNILDARLTGLRMTLQWVESTQKPFVEINYAIQAEDLLTVMWARFYDMIVSKVPIARCPCGKVFTQSRPDQKYCDRPCQNRLNQKRYRDNKKATPLPDAQ